MDEVLFSHMTDDWATPPDLYWFYVQNLGFFDPCPLHADFDGLAIDWPQDRGVFLNPPLSKIRDFVEKAMEEYKKKPRDIYLLVPARTDTYWFHRLLNFGCDLEFFQGRLKFGGFKNGAPFPCVMIRLNWFCSCFEGRHVCKVDAFSRKFILELYQDYLYGLRMDAGEEEERDED